MCCKGGARTRSARLVDLMSDPINASWFTKALLCIPGAAMAYGALHFMHVEGTRER